MTLAELTSWDITKALLWKDAIRPLIGLTVVAVFVAVVFCGAAISAWRKARTDRRALVARQPDPAPAFAGHGRTCDVCEAETTSVTLYGGDTDPVYQLCDGCRRALESVHGPDAAMHELREFLWHVAKGGRR